MNIARRIFLLSLLIPYAHYSEAKMTSDEVKNIAFKTMVRGSGLTGLAIAATSAGYLFYRDPKPKDKSGVVDSRFDVKKLKPSYAKTNPKEFMKNFWYFYLDEVIGWTFKDKALKAKFADDGSTELKHSKKRLPHGLGGYGAAFAVSQTKAVKPIAVWIGALVGAKYVLGGDFNKIFKWIGAKDLAKDKDKPVMVTLSNDQINALGTAIGNAINA